MAADEVAKWSDDFGYDTYLTKQETLPLVSTRVYPNVDGGSRSPVCTGLGRWGTKWVMAEDGRENALDTTFESGIIVYDANLVQLARFTAAGLGLTGHGSMSCQGLAVDSDNTVWAIFKDTAGGANSVLAHINLTTGALLGTTSISGTMNGLMLDGGRSLFYGLTDSGTLNRSLKASPATYITPSASFASLANLDHLHWICNDKALMTLGANGVDGHVYLLDMSKNQPVVLKDWTLPGCKAIEGAVYVEEGGAGYIYVNSDRRFHAAEAGDDPRENMQMKYGPVSLT